MLVLRLPLSNGRPQEQIVVSTNEPLPEPRIAILAAVGSRDGDPYKKLQLTLEQWTSINNIREEWCANSLTFTVQQSDPFYDIGLRCQSSSFRSSKQVLVPIEKLPIELQELIRLMK